MGTLTLITLLNFVSTDFCANRAAGMDTLKSVLIAYSRANDRFGGANVRAVISDSVGVEAVAVATVVAKCPNLL